MKTLSTALARAWGKIGRAAGLRAGNAGSHGVRPSVRPCARHLSTPRLPPPPYLIKVLPGNGVVNKGVGRSVADSRVAVQHIQARQQRPQAGHVLVGKQLFRQADNLARLVHRLRGRLVALDALAGDGDGDGCKRWLELLERGGFSGSWPGEKGARKDTPVELGVERQPRGAPLLWAGAGVEGVAALALPLTPLAVAHKAKLLRQGDASWGLGVGGEGRYTCVLRGVRRVRLAAPIFYATLSSGRLT